MRDEDHLSAAAWNVLAMIHQEEAVFRGLLPESLMNGLPDYTPKAKEPPAVTLEEFNRLATIATGIPRLER
jgi:hypothetical protein